VIAVLIAVNILAGLFLIGVVLLQSGKGADMGAAFGGSSTTVFGASGAGNLLTKLTAGTAAVFMGTSLILAVISARDQSVFANSPEPAAAPAAAAPDGQPTDGVDAKAAAEARGQDPLVADETDLPGDAPAAAPSDLGPAGLAGGEGEQASPLASDSQREAAGDDIAPAPDAPAGAATGDPVDNPTGAAVDAPAGDAPANPTGAATVEPTGDTAPNPATPPPAPAPAGAGAQQ
jgi:preprotein translocase subunit SecG